MVAQLNHLIIPARDKEKAARFLAGILGLEVGPQWARFLPVRTSNGVTLDFSDSSDFRPQHYAFLLANRNLMRRSNGSAKWVSNSTQILTFLVPARSTICTVDLPLLKDGGAIVLTGSCAGIKGTPAFGVYGATKAALSSFVRTWTSDLKDRHIRSNVTSPGPIDTPAIDGLPAEAVARIVSTIPMGRMGESDEIAKAALFLVSDDSSFVTGIELFVDGGRGQI